MILFWRFFAAVRLSGLTFSNPMNTLRPYRERKLRNRSEEDRVDPGSQVAAAPPSKAINSRRFS